MGIWKIVAIVALLGVLLGYGIYENKPPAPIVGGPNQPLPTGPAPADNTKAWIGKPAIAWNIAPNYWMNTGGKALQLKDTLGKVTLVEFFRIDCPHCQEAAPEMVQIYNMLGPRGLNIVAIQAPGSAADESDWGNVQSTIKEWHVTYPVAFDEGSQEFKKYGFSMYPTVMILDKQGIVRFAQSGFDKKDKRKNLLDALNKLMGLGGPGGVSLQPIAAAK